MLKDDIKLDLVKPDEEKSRYETDFVHDRLIGRGGFGIVARCQHRLDRQVYAVKIIRLMDKDYSLREVEAMCVLNHAKVVRYFQSWIDHGLAEIYEEKLEKDKNDDLSYAESEESEDQSYDEGSITEYDSFLCIQMELCHRTLGDVLRVGEYELDVLYSRRIIRQVLEGLVHIHGRGIVHRDLNPKNIFLDENDTVKIGDFGLAKTMKPELDDTISSDEVGTSYYIAPECQQRKLDQKVDIYSLGVVLFELWHPFGSKMERSKILDEVKKGEIPSSCIDKYPEVVSMLKSCMSPHPAERPSAADLLGWELLQ